MNNLLVFIFIVILKYWFINIKYLKYFYYKLILNYTFVVDLSCTNNFEVELGSYLRHCSNASRKLKKLAINAAELKLNNQVRFYYGIIKVYS